MTNPCNSLYYDYISDCTDYDELTSSTTTTTTTSTTTATTTTTNTTDYVVTNTTMPEISGATDLWVWLGPLLGVAGSIAIGLAMRNPVIRRFVANAIQWLNDHIHIAFDLNVRFGSDDELASFERVPGFTPPPGYDEVIQTSDVAYVSHELDSNQSSFPLRSLSGTSVSAPPTPPPGRYLTDRIIYRGSATLDAEVSHMIQRMFADSSSVILGDSVTLSSERDLSSADSERRASSLVPGTNVVEADMDISSIYSEGDFASAESELVEEPARRRGPVRSTRNPNPKYH